jgi:hypothetical protein
MFFRAPSLPLVGLALGRPPPAFHFDTRAKMAKLFGLVAAVMIASVSDGTTYAGAVRDFIVAFRAAPASLYIPFPFLPCLLLKSWPFPRVVVKLYLDDVVLVRGAAAASLAPLRPCGGQLRGGTGGDGCCNAAAAVHIEL